MKLETKDALENKEVIHIDVGFEWKQIEEDVDPNFFVFEGLASTFGNVDLGDDVVQAGAFIESLQKEIPVILWQHSSRDPIGMPIEIKEVPEGLFVKAKLPREDTFVSGRVIPQMKVGSVRKMSIGFIVLEEHLDNETGIRTLIKVQLKEVSLVTFPMNTQASVTGFKTFLDNIDIPDDNKELILKAFDGFQSRDEKVVDVNAAKEITTTRDFEKTLRESGVFSNDAATLLAKHFSYQGELDEENDDDDQGELDQDDLEAKQMLEELNGLFKSTEEGEISNLFKSMNSTFEVKDE